MEGNSERDIKKIRERKMNKCEKDFALTGIWNAEEGKWNCSCKKCEMHRGNILKNKITEENNARIKEEYKKLTKEVRC